MLGYTLQEQARRKSALEVWWVDQDSAASGRKEHMDRCGY